MQGTVLYGARDIRFEDARCRRSSNRLMPSSACRRRAYADRTCGRIEASSRSIGPTPMGHEYCGIVEEVGSAVKSVKPRPVRHRLVRHIRQHLPTLPARVSVLVRRTASSSQGAGAAPARPAGGWDVGGDARVPSDEHDPEPAGGLGRAGHRLVRRGCGQREAGHHRRGGRRRSGGSARRALGEADGRRANHRDEPSRHRGRSSHENSARLTS